MRKKLKMDVLVVIIGGSSSVLDIVIAVRKNTITDIDVACVGVLFYAMNYTKK